MSNTATRRSSDRDQRLVELVDSGVERPMIAARLGISLQQVRKVYQRMKGRGMNATPCSALVDGKCINGFLVTRGCLYFDNWNPERAPVPICCDEDRAGLLYPDTGAPSAIDAKVGL